MKWNEIHGTHEKKNTVVTTTTATKKWNNERMSKIWTKDWQRGRERERYGWKEATKKTAHNKHINRLKWWLTTRLLARNTITRTRNKILTITHTYAQTQRSNKIGTTEKKSVLKCRKWKYYVFFCLSLQIKDWWVLSRRESSCMCMTFFPQHHHRRRRCRCRQQQQQQHLFHILNFWFFLRF